MEEQRARLTEIVEKSAFLHERLGAEYCPKRPTEIELEAAQKRLSHWNQQVARGDDVSFDRRLAWDGLERKKAQELAAGVRLRDPGRLPSWAEYLEHAMADSSNEDAVSIERLEKSPILSPDSPIPFEHLFVPWVEYATEKLKVLSGSSWGLLSEKAKLDIQRSLLRTLSWTAGKTLDFEFCVWRSLPETSLAAAQSPGRQLYKGFLQNLLQGGMSTLFQEYPVLARWMARASEQWVSFYVEFLHRLAQDMPELEKTFCSGRPLVQVRTISTGLSDRHNGGKSVLHITFESGVSCFYKPRNCKSESDYNKLLIWMNQRGAPLPFQAHNVIDRSGYGWVEEVLHQDCQDEEELRRYYARAGMLLALLYTLQASDCNFENIISHGEQPVLIDTETFLQPRPRVEDSDPWKALETASRTIYYDSVFRLALLPQWIARPGGDKMDVSGFGSGTGRRGSVQKRTWVDVNTDEMSLKWERTVVGGDIRGVRLRGQPANASDYLEQIISGFDEMYRFLLQNREQLWAQDGPLPQMTGFSTRIVVRNTVTYMGLLENCLLPQHLRDGFDASLWLEVLTRLFSHSEEKPHQWPMVAAEQASLLDLSIPRFEAPSDGDALEVGTGNHIAGYFTGPSFSLFKARFYELSENDLDLQKRYIRSAFGYFAPSTCSLEVPTISANGGSQSLETFAQQAMAIAETIQEKSIREPEGGASWITQVYNMDSQFWQLHPIGLYFYDGIGGIALFLAALERATGDTRFHNLLASILKVLKHYSSEQMRTHLTKEGVGAGLGSASLAYSLARIGSLLEDEELLARAVEVAGLISERQIAADQRLDTIGGAAGCLLVLRTLHQMSSDPRLLERAVACGDRLLETRTATPSGLRSWRTIKGKFLAGLSHGAAGMIYALSELYKLTGREAYRAAAAEAQEYEDSLFSEEKQNWPNLLLPLKDGGFDFWNSWCHGAPGIGLSRLASRDCLDGETVHRDLENALRTAASPKLTELDAPCCGNLGRIELLLQAGQKLGREDCLKTARELGMAVVSRASQNGAYGAGIKNGIYVPSFHQGMAGVGYQLLRLAKPDQLPSLLCWE